jgi:hypothetical protein
LIQSGVYREAILINRIHLSDATLARLKALAEPFVDTEPEHVIRRLLDSNEESLGNGSRSSDSRTAPQPIPLLDRPQTRNTESRAPRERGATFDIDGRHIQAVSVRDCYEQVLKLLVEDHRPELDRLLPFKTSRQRYLVAKANVHPNGNDFVVPVKHHGYYMEAHKDYKNAIAHLKTLVADKLKLPFKYLG